MARWLRLSERSRGVVVAAWFCAALGVSFGCEGRAIAIVYVGEDAGTDASQGGSEGQGEGGSGSAAGSGGVGARAGSGGTAGSGADGGAPSDAGPDVSLPDADLPDAEPPDADDPDSDVPPTEHCKPALDWTPEDTAAELELLEAVNAWRALGATCSGVKFEPVPALQFNTELRCSARLHVQDMVDRNYFGLITPDGVEPAERMSAAGWEDVIWGEDIFLGDETPEDVVALWISAGGDQCANVVSPRFVAAGVGHFGNRWALDLGGSNGGTPQPLRSERRIAAPRGQGTP